MKRVYGPYKKSTDHIKDSTDNRKESTDAGRTRLTKASQVDAGRRQRGQQKKDQQSGPDQSGLVGCKRKVQWMLVDARQANAGRRRQG